jgi:hypothetical protein
MVSPSSALQCQGSGIQGATNMPRCRAGRAQECKSQDINSHEFSASAENDNDSVTTEPERLFGR